MKGFPCNFSSTNIDWIFKSRKFKRREYFLDLCSIYNPFGFWLTCSNSFLKLDTFVGWLSQKIALTGKPQLERILRESKSSVLSQLTSMLVSGNDFVTYGIDSFKPTLMKQTMPLYSSPLLSQPIISPSKYSRLFWKYVSSKIILTSSKIFPSIRNAFAHITASTVPLLIFYSNDKDGNGKPWSKNLYDWIDVYLKNKLCLMILAE